MTPSNEVNTATGAAPDLDERIATLEGGWPSRPSARPRLRRWQT